MSKRIGNKGFSFIELIVAIAIMAALVGALSPQLMKYIQKARQVRVEKEASEFARAAQIAFVDVSSQGKTPGEDAIYHITEVGSPYYKNKTLYGNLTNWTVKNGVVTGASNAPFADEFFSLLGIVYGKDKWKSGSSSIRISANEPKLNPGGSLTKECIFQLFYDHNGNVIVEYSREGYFVRMDNSHVVESVKVENESVKHFTSWSK